MKKQYLSLAIIGIAACCLGACKKTNNSEFDSLNKMLEVSYSQLQITVTDTFDENTYLKSEYAVTYSADTATVNYSVEQFVEISLDSPASTGVKTTLTGVAVVQYDTVSVTGDEVDLDFYAIAYPKLTFKKDYFKNIRLTDVYLIADVKSPSDFLGSQIDCSNMTIRTLFSDAFENIQINYTSSKGNQVKYTYIFTA